jgi:hypothetical protein
MNNKKIKSKDIPLIPKIKVVELGWAQVVESLPSVHEALGSNHSTVKKHRSILLRE